MVRRLYLQILIKNAGNFSSYVQVWDKRMERLCFSSNAAKVVELQPKTMYKYIIPNWKIFHCFHKSIKKFHYTSLRGYFPSLPPPSLVCFAFDIQHPRLFQSALRSLKQALSLEVKKVHNGRHNLVLVTRRFVSSWAATSTSLRHTCLWIMLDSKCPMGSKMKLREPAESVRALQKLLKLTRVNKPRVSFSVPHHLNFCSQKSRI